MNLADTLKARAESSGHKKKQGAVKDQEPVQVVKDSQGLASLLSARAKETNQKVIKPAPSKVIKDATAFSDELKARAASRDPSKIDTNFTTGDVPVWSFSTLKQYESCPYAVYLNKIERKPQQSSVAAARGTALHDKAEKYVRGETQELDPELAKHFSKRFIELRELYEAGKVKVEEDWGIRKDWSPCTWKDSEIWGRGKLDAFVQDGDTCRIIDHKSGRKWGNEYKHSDQGISYALHTYHRFPEVELFSVEFWYLDHGDVMAKHFTRSQLSVLLPRYHKRAMDMTMNTVWDPKPSCSNCKWCPYGKGKFGTGDCEHAE